MVKGKGKVREEKMKKRGKVKKRQEVRKKTGGSEEKRQEGK